MKDILEAMGCGGPITDPALRSVTPSGAPFDLAQELKRRDSDVMQQATRMQLPSVPLLSIPDFCRTVVATSANYVEDVRLGPNTHVIMFLAVENTAFLVSFQGGFPLPYVPQSADNPIDPIIMPTKLPILTYGCNTVYVGIPAIGQAVSVVGWRQL